MSDEGDGEAGGGSGDLSVIEENPYLPDLHFGPKIPHYYGDYVRQLFMICGAAMLIFSPFLTAANPGVLPFEIGGAILIVILGALTNPVKQMSMLADAIAAGVLVVTYELLALNSFYAGAMIAFLEREILAIAFLFALYFSLKTLRNMVFHTIGKKNVVGTFMEERED